MKMQRSLLKYLLALIIVGILIYCLYKFISILSISKSEESQITYYSDCVVVGTYGSLCLVDEINGDFEGVSICENEVSDYIDYSSIKLGQILRIYYDGGILEEYPSSFSRISNVEILEDTTVDEVECDMGVEYDVFSSLEEFSDYLAMVQPGEGISNLASLEYYFLPVGIPEGFELYKITSGIVNIGFWYLPKTALTSEENIRSAEARENNFLFISPRTAAGSVNLEYERSNTITYDTSGYSGREILWLENGCHFQMYVPRETAHMYMDADTISDICEIKIVAVE